MRFNIMKIGVFYLFFYAFLASFFAVMLTIFYQTLDLNNSPTYTPGDGSSLLSHPALGFRPLQRADNIESTLIWYKNGDEADVEHWVTSLNDFMAPYENATNSVDCSDGKPAKEGKFCSFRTSLLGGTCNKANKWGYMSGSPCVLLKLNKMLGWKPDVYKSLEELPDDMPSDLKAYITGEKAKNGGRMPKLIWVSCTGENPADEEYLGEIKYHPWRGFPTYFFPYRNSLDYRSPVVALEFMGLAPNILINIECKVWAKNIEHDRSNRVGLVHFEILKD
ncbi:hypothetical protein HAZT_HAZT000941 [Hyalella azteca]|uniref:Sodium/potassium-transporting ATPase subunit beta n=1 Tax=Hyalella azteca TaxID=294128 RepID=A0A6A0GYP8_HYAAZ|nr:hypothetical protein HAZT_HAZT000941 [Hyalella azteca]